MLHHRDSASSPPDATLGNQAKEFHLGFNLPWPSGSWSPPWPRPFTNCSVWPGLGGSKLLPFKNDGGHCVLGNLQCCRNVWVPFLRSVPWHNPVSELYGQLLQPHGLVFVLTWIINAGTLYRHVPFQIMFNQLNVPQVDSNQVVERMINGNRMHLSSIESHSKGSEYLCK